MYKPDRAGRTSSRLVDFERERLRRLERWRISGVQIRHSPPSSLERSGLSEEMSEPAALSRLSRDSKDTGESAAAAMAAQIPNFSPGRNTTVSFAIRA
jgi:hypothetical protein